jgi:coenzyme Q-binding protein COQ10
LPVVELSAFIEVPPRVAYAVAKNHDEYPKFMKDCIAVRTLERDEGDRNTLTEWVWRFSGKPLRWVEREVHDDENLHIRFWQTQGDMKKFEGEWRFLPEGGGTRFVSRTEFDLGIPMFAALLDPVAKVVLRNAIAQMIEAIKKKAEAGPA